MSPGAKPLGGRIRELVEYFLRLGLIGFGGPVALVGQMERELVGERGWLTREQMREAIAICQSLPGPLAIQVGIYISYLRGGFWGAWAGGWAFIFMGRCWIPSDGPKSFPLDGAGGFGRHVVNDAVDAADLVDDSRRGLGEERMLEGIGIRRHAVG